MLFFDETNISKKSEISEISKHHNTYHHFNNVALSIKGLNNEKVVFKISVSFHSSSFYTTFIKQNSVSNTFVNLLW